MKKRTLSLFNSSDFVFVLRFRGYFLYITPFGLANVGTLGEEIAARLLVRKGCRILDRNWRAGRCEFDIVAYSPKVIVFCEVKTRKQTNFSGYTAFDAVDRAKRDHMRHLACRYLKRKSRLVRSLRPRGIRFDIITVHYRGKFSFGKAYANHYPAAFKAPI